jgi:Protein of unknown function (DUF2911)
MHAAHGMPYDGDRLSPNRTAMVEIGSGAAVVEWSAPSVKDRDLFGPLIPDESVWRTGANEATVIHFDQDVTINGEKLEAGNYALFTIGSEDEFTFIFNSVSQTWGAFSHDESKDVLRVEVPVVNGAHQEELLFSFSDVTGSATTLTLSWGTVTASVEIKLD